MKRPQKINSVESKAILHKKHVEEFVQQNLPPQTMRESKIAGMGRFAERYKEIECCAAETPVIGTVEILFDNTKYFNNIESISAPVSSRFFVFCTRDGTNNYKVTCSHSLS